jgi:hypothetical protein
VYSSVRCYCTVRIRYCIVDYSVALRVLYRSTRGCSLQHAQGSMPHFYHNLLYSTCDQLIARGVISTNTVLVTGPTNFWFEVRIGCKCFFLSFFASADSTKQGEKQSLCAGSRWGSQCGSQCGSRCGSRYKACMTHCLQETRGCCTVGHELSIVPKHVASMQYWPRSDQDCSQQDPGVRADGAKG